MRVAFPIIGLQKPLRHRDILDHPATFVIVPESRAIRKLRRMGMVELQ